MVLKTECVKRLVHLGVAILVAFQFPCSAYGVTDQGVSAHAALEVGLKCDESTEKGSAIWRDWDQRFSQGRSRKVCIDASQRVSIIPVRSGVRYDKFADAIIVWVRMMDADGTGLRRIFDYALGSAAPGTLRESVILLDGKVIVSAFVAGPFSGTLLDIDPASADASEQIAKILAGVKP